MRHSAFYAALAAMTLGFTIPAAAGEVTADIQTFQYQPKEISVSAGDKVVFTNRDAIAHSVTAEAANGEPAFDTGLFEQGDTGIISVGKPGTYAFYCTRHPSMQGTLIVK